MSQVSGKFVLMAMLFAMAGCATRPPGAPKIVQAAAFPIDVQPQQQSVDGSVFPASTSGSLYEPRRDWRPGDLVTIDIVTSATADNTDNAALKRTGKLSDSLSSFMGVPLNFGHLNGSSFSPHFEASFGPGIYRGGDCGGIQQYQRSGRGGDHACRSERHIGAGRADECEH